MHKLLICIIIACSICSAGISEELYKIPSQDIIDIVDAPSDPYTYMSPTGEKMMMVSYDPIPSLEHVSKEVVKLAGLRFYADNYAEEQKTFITKVDIFDFQSRELIPAKIPKGVYQSPFWSHDGKWIVIVQMMPDRLLLHVIDPETGKARNFPRLKLNGTTGTVAVWMPDNRHLLVNVQSESGITLPDRPPLPKGPIIQESSGVESAAWTLPEVLKNAYDELLFDYYATSQLMMLDVVKGKVKKFGNSNIYNEIRPSPDGEFVLIMRVLKPYSYNQYIDGFPYSIELWNKNGRFIKELYRHESAETVPLGGVITGMRNVRWMPLAPHTLHYAEALDGGDPDIEADFRDRVMILDDPVHGEPYEFTQTQYRFIYLRRFDDSSIFWITEFDRDRRWVTTREINRDQLSDSSKIIFDHSYRELYNHPGQTVFRQTSRGEWVVKTENGQIWLESSGQTPTGQQPWVERFDLETHERVRIFHSSEAEFEEFHGFVFGDPDKLLTRKQSPSQPGNIFVRDLTDSSLFQITHFTDPHPQLTGMNPQLMTYMRQDSVSLSGKLYTPVDWDGKTRLPLVIWAYPQEYSADGTAGQVATTTNQFTRISGTSPLFVVTQGYALLYDATMPVVGDPKTANDTFIEQITASAEAAIDHLDSLGIIDPHRVAVMGHSYGAFMVVNLLAHSDLFALGIARTGAYNRTLTPFGFQGERRNLWEARDTYIKMSPFMYADKINEPLLMFHGDDDSNPGTFPIQSDRLFAAIKGNGGIARYVKFPFEGHGYRARESVLHYHAETFEWLNRYVKNRPEVEMEKVE